MRSLRLRCRRLSLGDHTTEARCRVAVAERRGPEVAERAGHSVDVLLKVYAKCIDGQRDQVNRAIEGPIGG